jgi:hypothetical protein
MFHTLLIGYLPMQFLIDLPKAVHKVKEEALELAWPLLLSHQRTAILDRIQLFLSKLKMLFIQLVYLLLQID